METMPDKSPLKVEALLFLRVWLFLSTAGGIFASLFLIIGGLQFDSKYSLLYLGAGIFTMPYGLLTTMFVWPAFTREMALYAGQRAGWPNLFQKTIG
ncbi:DUF5381 family protein [Bacillus massiliglaciei]|uniref:DUF5381 family protein n=1 Tax=Bacillus massiliglaciei TaxID=1816693 RepID=UPI000DA5EF6E|nr:DUF5381 family protein [Bacillus massiliglaciei]